MYSFLGLLTAGQRFRASPHPVPVGSTIHTSVSRQDGPSRWSGRFDTKTNCRPSGDYDASKSVPPEANGAGDGAVHRPFSIRMNSSQRRLWSALILEKHSSRPSGANVMLVSCSSDETIPGARILGTKPGFY